MTSLVNDIWAYIASLVERPSATTLALRATCKFLWKLTPVRGLKITPANLEDLADLAIPLYMARHERRIPENDIGARIRAFRALVEQRPKLQVKMVVEAVPKEKRARFAVLWSAIREEVPSITRLTLRGVVIYSCDPTAGLLNLDDLGEVRKLRLEQCILEAAVHSTRGLVNCRSVTFVGCKSAGEQDRRGFTVIAGVTWPRIIGLYGDPRNKVHLRHFD